MTLKTNKATEKNQRFQNYLLLFFEDGILSTIQYSGFERLLDRDKLFIIEDYYYFIQLSFNTSKSDPQLFTMTASLDVEFVVMWK